MEPGVVRAAGAVVTRKGGDVLLVHRPKYDDWSFPKGKLDPGEHAVTAAVREVREETGLEIRLGPALAAQCYDMANGRTKAVDYWTARVVGDDDVSHYLPNDEIDRVEWVPAKTAPARLTYPYDRDTLVEARSVRHKTRAVVVLRHATAHPRRQWKGKDRDRPLADSGKTQAAQLVPLLAAFGVTSVHTSPTVRCVQTVLPFMDAAECVVTSHPQLSEEKASVEGIVDLVDTVIEARENTVLCTHRPVLPTVLDALGAPDTTLDTGALLVVHHRGGRVVATEMHRANPTA